MRALVRSMISRADRKNCKRMSSSDTIYNLAERISVSFTKHSWPKQIRQALEQLLRISWILGATKQRKMLITMAPLTLELLLLRQVRVQVS